MRLCGETMANVAFSLNGRTYRLACKDGDEQRLRAMSQEVQSKLDELIAEFGQVGETRLMVMAALLLADELLDARALCDAATAPDKPEKKRSATGS